MGKVLSLLIGAIVAVVGVILLIAWWYELLFVLRGIIPGVLILGGVIAVIAGFSEFKDVLKSKGEKK
ncbi:MAG: hypothetical protein DRP85_03945 [Candidatus Makaraimicrobium thalassicum]|nr:MAG: hypothetical protein DRP85_03945 [Candidatus Omnitrophota bacterium]